MANDPARSLAAYRTRSDAAHRLLEVRENLAYGPDPAERLDVFPGPGADAPLVAWVHGGHWQEGSKEDGAFAAVPFVEAGFAFAAIGYGLAPARTLPEMTASVRRALHWLAEHAAGFGAGPVYAAGSSAGGHLVAMALCSSGAAGDDPAPVAGAALLSGTYDLQALLPSYVNEALGLDEETAEALSPVRHLPLATRHLVLARGEAETAEYARLHDLLATRLKEHGQDFVELVVPGRDHFDVVFDLADPATELGSVVLNQLLEISREC